MNRFERGTPEERVVPPRRNETSRVAKEQPTDIISFGKDYRPRVSPKPLITNPGKPTSEDVKARRGELMLAFAKGVPTRELAERYDVSPTAINRDRVILEAKHGLTFPRARKGGRRPTASEIAARREAEKALFELGMSGGQVGNEFSITETQANRERRFLEKKYGIVFKRSERKRGKSDEVYNRVQREKVLFMKGMNPAQVAELKGISERTARRDMHRIEEESGMIFERGKRGRKPLSEGERLKRQNEKRKARQRTRREDARVMRILKNIRDLENRRPTEVAKNYGLSVAAVYRGLSHIALEERRLPSKEQQVTAKEIVDLKKKKDLHKRPTNIVEIRTPKKRTKRGISEDRLQRWNGALELRKKNVSDREIGEIYGLSESTIATEWSLMRKAGIDVPKKPIKRKQLDQETLVVLAQPKKAADIAVELGTSTHAVHERRRRQRQRGLAIPKRRAGRVPSPELQQTMKEAVRLRDEGMQPAEIAKQLSVDPKHIRNYIYRGRKLDN